MPDKADREDEALMPCDHPGCARESTHSRAVWVWGVPGHMKVEYYCPEHAPAGATTFEEDDESEWNCPSRLNDVP